jgi:hypothetical protein
VATAALRSAASLLVRADDHAAVLKVWAKRHRDLSRSRNQVVSAARRAVRPDPGRGRQRDQRHRAARVLERAEPSGTVRQACCELAAEFLADLRRIDAQLRQTGGVFDFLG